ncbi:MAG: FAD-dependent oxidoreductase [Planctomycetes bacterium]|nr:FAD-dependent oxidoreductase [Planctomycetota bacterium]
MARSPLLEHVRRACRLARLADRRSAPPVGELVELERARATPDLERARATPDKERDDARATPDKEREARLSRRNFLLASAGMALTAAGAGVLAPLRARAQEGRDAPRIAIVGGGIAGLACAWRLKEAGYRAEVYEAARRTGGRIQTVADLVAPGLLTELGGEFIDSDHEDMLALIREFGLELLDSQGPSEKELVREAYYFEGRMIPETEIVEAFRPVARRMAADLERLGDSVDYRHEGGAGELDRTSAALYLERLGATGWFGKLLEVVMATEMGLDAGEQSALNVPYLLEGELDPERFRATGSSDERYRVKGGNQQVVDELARRLEGQIHAGHWLSSVRARGEGFTLAFQGPGRASVEVQADLAVLAIPFSVLREVDLSVELSDAKKKAIAELGYGTNSKVFSGTARRVWRDLGHAGTAYSDEPFQLAWDHSRGQAGDAGGITFFLGGRAGAEIGAKTAEANAARLLPGLDRVFPGVQAVTNARTSQYAWPDHDFSKGSYSCYRTGQWTTIAGVEGEPAGNLFFAGEHTSREFQGYMNGGARSGRRTAEALVKLLRG